MAPISAVVAVEDRRRPEPHAPALARRLVATTAVPLVVQTIDDTDDVEIRDVAAGREGALLIVDAHGGGVPGDRLFDDEVEDALTSSSVPIMVIGPGATSARDIRTVLAAVDHSAPVAPALDFLARWRATFPTVEMAVVMLEAPSGWDVSDEVAADPLGAELDARGLGAIVEHVTTIEPWQSIRDTAAARRDPMVVVAAPRWPGTTHWYSTARLLIRNAPCPVVVVPLTA